MGTSMGAEPYQPAAEWGAGGFATASVVDPFGDILGATRNPHYLAVLGAS